IGLLPASRLAWALTRSDPPEEDALPAGKKSGRRYPPRRRRASLLYPSGKPNAGSALPVGRTVALRQARGFRPVWWVTFGEQTWVTSRERRSRLGFSQRVAVRRAG